MVLQRRGVLGGNKALALKNLQLGGKQCKLVFFRIILATGEGSSA